MPCVGAGVASPCVTHSSCLGRIAGFNHLHWLCVKIPNNRCFLSGHVGNLSRLARAHEQIFLGCRLANAHLNIAKSAMQKKHNSQHQNSFKTAIWQNREFNDLIFFDKYFLCGLWPLTSIHIYVFMIGRYHTDRKPMGYFEMLFWCRFDVADSYSSIFRGIQWFNFFW